MSLETAHRMNPDTVRFTSRQLLRFLSKGVTLTGEEFIPLHGPAIVVANHMGNIESLGPYAYLPETPVLIAKIENFEVPVVGDLLRRLHAIPVNREDIDSQVIKDASEVLKRQRGIIFTYPEGTRGRDTDGDRTVLKPAKGGVIFIAQLVANALNEPIPISPWAIWGTEGVLPVVDESGPLKHRFAIHRNPVNISIGEPLYINPSETRRGQDRKQFMEDQINTVMLRLRDMLPKQYHGYYANK